MAEADRFKPGFLFGGVAAAVACCMGAAGMLAGGVGSLSVLQAAPASGNARHGMAVF